ncbi:MAG TPA: hypothetical protein VGF60_00910 [Xanthobacteraceae bacterium]
MTPLAFAAGACILLAVRAFWGEQHWSRELRAPLLVAIVLIAGLALLDGALAAKAYPVVLSAGLALLFGLSLRQPRSLVERFAELSGDVLSPAGRRYCRRVTLVWSIWLALNTAVSAGLALAGSLAAWTLWTGLIAYVVTGAIFGGEFMLRRMLRRRHAA